MTAKLIDDCFVLDKDRLPHDEAIAILKSRVRPVVGVEQVPLADAAGRFLAEDIVSPRAIPAHDNAAVDGYAFAHAAYDHGPGREAQGSRRSRCGSSVQRALRRAAARCASSPARSCRQASTRWRCKKMCASSKRAMSYGRSFPPGLKPGANRRLAGEDAQEGAVLLEPGARLRPQDVASAAATGLGRLACYAKLKVAILSTGDEILRPGETFLARQGL